MLDFSFTKKEGEEVILLLHRHWFSLLRSVFKFLTFFILPLLILTWFFGFGYIFSSSILSIFYFFWFLVGLTYLFYEWIVWYYDIYIITNKRIIDVEQKSLFSRSVSETSLDKIQDVTYAITGAFPTFLNFGDVKIQTAGASEVIKLEEVASPGKVSEKIFEAIKIFEKEEGGPVTAEELLETIKKQKELKKEEDKNKS